MKNLTFLFVTAVLLCAHLTPLKAQEKQAFSMGFQLQELQESFGLGLNLTVPLPAHWPGLRVAGHWHWLDLPDQNHSRLTDFQTIRVGVAPDGWQVAEKIRVYGEGGVLFLIADSELSDKAFTSGGYGLFGFEFFTQKTGGSALFLEMGATSSGLRMERMEGIPRFGAGFLLGAGFRVALKK